MKRVVTLIAIVSLFFSCSDDPEHDFTHKPKPDPYAITEILPETESGHNKEPYVSEAVELMGLIFRLAGSPGYYNGCNVPSVAESADSYFAHMTNHKAVTLAKSYRQRGVAYDAVTGYANQLIFYKPDKIVFATNYKEGSNTSFDRWDKTMKKEMLAAINDFYKKSDFHSWFVSIEEEQKAAIAAFKSVCDIDYTWFNTFYGKNNNLASRIILSFMIGSHNNGISLQRSDGTLLLTPVFGSLSQSGSTIRFGGDTNLIIHEFSHPYCNPLIDKYWSSMSSKANQVFSVVKEQMASQAYGTAQTMMHETLVRSCSISYLRTHNQENLAELYIDYNESKGFMLVRTIVDRLEEYEREPDKYGGTLDGFMREIIDAINNFQI